MCAYVYNNLHCNLRPDETFGLAISWPVRTDLRSQNKAQGPASRCQGSQHPKGILGFIPKTSNIFQSPPAAQALISKCPQWPRAHKHCPSLLSGG